jgi:hypothetical protein
MQALPNLCAAPVVLDCETDMRAKEVKVKRNGWVVAAVVGVLAVAGAAHAAPAPEKKLSTQESIAVVVSQARFEFERSHADLGLVGSAVPLEKAALERVPSAPRVGLITGMLLPRPVARIATNALSETPSAALVR